MANQGKNKKPKQSKKSNKSSSSKKSNPAITILLIVLVIGIVAGAFFAYQFYLKKVGVDDMPPISIDDDSKDDNKEDDSKDDDKKDDEKENTKELGSANATKYISWNESLSIDKTSIFYQSNEEDIKNYYVDVDFSSDKETVFSKLYEVLKKTHVTKLDYSGKNSTLKMSTTWANYVLFDRDFDEDPITQEEVTSNKWKLEGAIVDLMYSEDNIVFESGWNGSKKGTDREHILPKSYGFNGIDGDTNAYEKIYAGCDAHNLKMADHAGNSTAHNNRLYSDLDTSTSTKVADPQDKSYSYYTDDYFMPQDEDKGDIARACFYMAARYRYFEEKDSLGYPSPAIGLSDNPMMPGSTIEPSKTKDERVNYGLLSTLLKWNEEDPVSENEMVRNNLVANLQGDRNPFIDYPSLANILFE